MESEKYFSYIYDEHKLGNHGTTMELRMCFLMATSKIWYNAWDQKMSQPTCYL